MKKQNLHRALLLQGFAFLFIINLFGQSSEGSRHSLKPPITDALPKKNDKPVNKNRKNEDYNHFKKLLADYKKVTVATNCAQNAVTAFSDSVFLPSLLFNLSEWELRKTKLEFSLAMEKYDLRLRICERDTTGCSKLEDPLIDYSKVIEINRRLLEEYPDQPFIDKVMYRTGICLYETGKRDSARVLFLQLVEQFPDSAYIPELIFRIGECYFDEQEYEKALETYNQILEIWNSPYFAMSLYKRAWCYYLLNDYPQSISTFFYLLNDIKLMEDLDTDLLGKSQVELRDEAIEYIALSFIDYGGVHNALSFIGEIGGSDFTPNILQKMAEGYFQRDFYEESYEVNQSLIKSFPLYVNAPDVHYNIFKYFEKTGQMDKAFQIRTTIAQQYAPNRPWAIKNNEPENLEKVAEIIKSIDFVIATPLLCSADSLYTTKNYEKAAELYKNFLKTFSEDNRCVHAAYFLSESLYELGNYEAAAVSYKYLVVNYPESEMREDAAYNRIICYENIKEQGQNGTLDTLNWIQTGRRYMIPLESTHQKNVIIACKDFVKWFPKTDRAIEIQLKLTDIFMKANQYKLSESILCNMLIAILKHKIGKQYHAKALSFMAQACFKQEDYQKAEKWYALLIKSNPDSADLIEKSKTMLASASFKIAETLKENGNADFAAMKFERAASEATDEKVAEAALFEAALQFEKAEKLRRSAINFEAFCRKYPQSENCEQALYHAAINREKLQQWYLAAANYIKLFEKNPNSPQGASALFNAGLNFEHAKDWASMERTFNDFIRKYPGESDKLLEAMFKVGYACEKSGRIFQANQSYSKIITRYQELQQREEFADDYIAAQAQFRLGEILHKQFNDIKLIPPFQMNLQRKQTAFNNMLQQCALVAKYNVAEWTTASFYNIGYAYEEFCQDILNSPAPQELSEDQLKDYWDMINQKFIIPLQSEALKYYKTNIELSIANNLKNDWTKKTSDRAAYLTDKLASYKGNIPDDNVKKAVDTVNTPGTVPQRAL